MALQISFFDEDFTYSMGATWRTYFAHLVGMAGNNGGSYGSGGSAEARRRCWRPPGLLRLQEVVLRLPREIL
jgi:hypothetical protein